RRLGWHLAGVAVVAALALFAGLPAAVAVDGGASGEPSPGSVSAQNDIQAFTTVFNTDVVYAGVGGLRSNASGGDITLAGATGPVTKAFLFWQGPTNSSDPTANANVTLGGQAVVGTNIGFSSSNCWGFENSQAYRADVTSIVTGNGT